MNTVELPKWLEDALTTESARYHYTHASAAREAGTNIARLVLERLEKTRERDTGGVTPDGDEQYGLHQYDQGRESVRKEVLGE